MNTPPRPTHFTRRLAIWVALCALLLKAAVPLLASVSAQAQGLALVEVCTVYGVSLVPLAGDGHESAPDHSTDHDGGGHCALTALTTLAAADPLVFAPLPALPGDASRARGHASSQARDLCATWVARLKHGPPAFS